MSDDWLHAAATEILEELGYGGLSFEVKLPKVMDVVRKYATESNIATLAFQAGVNEVYEKSSEIAVFTSSTGVVHKEKKIDLEFIKNLWVKTIDFIYNNDIIIDEYEISNAKNPEDITLVAEFILTELDNA